MFPAGDGALVHAKFRSELLLIDVEPGIRIAGARDDEMRQPVYLCLQDLEVRRVHRKLRRRLRRRLR